MATGLELGLERLRARRQPLGSDDGDSSTEFVSKLKRDREEFKRDHPLPPLPSGAADAASKRQHVAPPASPGRPRPTRHPGRRHMSSWWSRPTATCSRTPSTRRCRCAIRCSAMSCRLAGTFASTAIASTRPSRRASLGLAHGAVLQVLRAAGGRRLRGGHLRLIWRWSTRWRERTRQARRRRREAVDEA